MTELSTQDTLFLKLETPEAPMHLGLLMTCRLPKGAAPDFMQELQVRLARRLALTPEWDRLTLKSAADQRKLVDEVKKRLARWEQDE